HPNHSVGQRGQRERREGVVSGWNSRGSRADRSDRSPSEEDRDRTRLTGVSSVPASGRPGTTGRVFGDRREAGRVLAGHLSHYRGDATAVVLGLPRGGVPVAYKVANAIGAPLDVFVVRKLGVPGQEELAMGAIASG